MSTWRPWREAVKAGEHTTPFIWISDKYKAVYFENPKVASTTMKSILKTDRSKLIYHLISDEHTLGEYNFARLNTRPYGQNSYPPLVFEDKFKDYFKFGFVRNPYDRYVSAYKMCIREAGAGNRAGFTVALGWFDKSGAKTRSGGKLRSGARAKAKYLASKYKKHTRENFREFFEKTIPYETDPNKMSKARHAAAINHHWAPQIHFVPSDRVKLDFVGRFENFEEDFKFVLDKLGITHEGEIPKLNTTKSSKYTDYFDCIEQRNMQFFYHHYNDDFEHFNYKRSI